MDRNHKAPQGAAVTTARTPAAVPVDDKQRLRQVLGNFATGVTVVTVGGRTPHGMTANAFTSVSIDPPLVLVCVRRDATMHDVLMAGGAFAISVLATHQENTARYFANAQRPRGAAQFDVVDWRPGAYTGAPLIGGSLAWLECGLWQVYDGGDHSIYIGLLMSIAQGEAGGALVFFNGQFRQLMNGGVR